MATPSPSPTPEVPRVAVRGEAHLEVEPETAGLGITVNARGRDRRSALDDLTRRNAEVVELVKSYGEAVERLETGFFSITPELSPHGRGERVRSYHGRVHIVAELSDFTALGELVTRASELELTRVDGPWWGLRPDSPVYREARRQAVHEAIKRARDYAEALDTTLTSLVEIADIGADGAEAFSRTAGRARSMAFAAATDDETPPPLDLEPQRRHVSAQVNARFTIAPPRL
ncbi:SIMPL domain-containing protein [Streptomyces brasiliensis]|nr:SIMPL domain-containing protein [Streptomyces brasiliensis]